VGTQHNKPLKKNKKKAKTLEVYDITQNNKTPQGHVFNVNDHVNKTGKNPLITTKNKPRFIDMSNVYFKHTEGIITTSPGKHYDKQKNKTEFPSTEIALIPIWCRRFGLDVQIKGFLINVN